MNSLKNWIKYQRSQQNNPAYIYTENNDALVPKKDELVENQALKVTKMGDSREIIMTRGINARKNGNMKDYYKKSWRKRHE